MSDFDKWVNDYKRKHTPQAPGWSFIFGGLVAQTCVWVMQGAAMAFGVYLTVWLLS